MASARLLRTANPAPATREQQDASQLICRLAFPAAACGSSGKSRTPQRRCPYGRTRCVRSLYCKKIEERLHARSKPAPRCSRIDSQGRARNHNTRRSKNDFTRSKQYQTHTKQTTWTTISSNGGWLCKRVRDHRRGDDGDEFLPIHRVVFFLTA